MFAGILILSAQMLSAQTDKSEVRKGNREYRKGEYREAEVDYRKALLKDSLSVAGNYNLACALYRQNQYDDALKVMKKVGDGAVATGNGADYYYNLGDIALARKDYKGAVDAFEQALLLRPEDLDAKENYIYAKKMLQQQQNQNQNQNQNQDQNQDQDQNDQQNQNNQNQDRNNPDQDQNGDNNQDPNQNNGDGQDERGQQEPKISPQAAQQMLQAIQAREKETQDKVNREKAAALRSRQKEKNW